MIKSAALTLSFESGGEETTLTFAGYALSSPSGDKTMSWNYRVLYIPENKDDIFGENSFSIREVFYNEEGEIEFWSEDNVAPTGTDFEELADDFDLMAEAFERPILMLTEDEDGTPSLVELEEDESEDESEEA